MGIRGGPSNSQRGPVRTYVLYFERLTGWTWEEQGGAAGLSEGAERGVFAGASLKMKRVSQTGRRQTAFTIACEV